MEPPQWPTCRCDKWSLVARKMENYLWLAKYVSTAECEFLWGNHQFSIIILLTVEQQSRHQHFFGVVRTYLIFVFYEALGKCFSLQWNEEGAFLLLPPPMDTRDEMMKIVFKGTRKEPGEDLTQWMNIDTNCIELWYGLKVKIGCQELI